MTHDWLLVETLGTEPAVVAQGSQTKNLVPISAFLRRNPNLMAIQTAIGETVRAGQGLSSITPKNDRVIRTEVVQMSDGRIHGVHVWVGPPDMEPPERPIPGPLIWDLSRGVATDTTESLLNSGRDPASEATDGRAFAEDLPMRDLNPSETKVLSMLMKPEPGMKFCTTWGVTDHTGTQITVGWCARTQLETEDDGTERLICRAMNWRSEHDPSTAAHDTLAERILNGLAQSGVHRVLVDLHHWKLLKWLDEPAPFFDWRAREAGAAIVHPDDAPHMARMTIEFGSGATTGVLRLPATDGDWVPVHMTINRVELDEDTFAGLVALRLPTAREIAAAGIEGVAEKPGKRKGRSRKIDPPNRPSLSRWRGLGRPVRRRAPCPIPILPSATRDSTVTTTSSWSTTHCVTAVCIARATADAWAHAASAPSASRPAAASDARSAALCARWRAITAEPTQRPPTVTATSTAIIAAATKPAEPRSAHARARPPPPPAPRC